MNSHAAASESRLPRPARSIAEVPEVDHDEPPRVEIIGLAEAQSRQDQTEAYLRRMLYQLEQRFGILDDDDPRKEMLARIQARIERQLSIPATDVVAIDSPGINAFVVSGHAHVYTYMGLLRELGRWCERHGRPMTEDMIAMVAAHESTHIDQHTEEGVVHEDYPDHDEKQRRLNAEYDADRGGLIALAQAGYNPREGLAAIQFLLSLSNDLPIGTSHPRSADRYRELVELVESPDTWLPNIEKEPTVVPAEVQRAFIDEPPGRPGTRLYRAEGLDHIEDMIAQAESFHDAVEVGVAAFVLDRHALFHHAAEQERMRKHYAQRIVLHNFAEVLNALHAAYYGYHYSEGRAEYLARASVAPDKLSRYMDREFDFGAQVEEGPYDEEKFERSLHTRLQRQRAEVIKAYDETLRFLSEQIPQAQAAADEDPDDHEKAAKLAARIELQRKVQHLRAQLEAVVDGVSADTLDTLISNADIDGPKEDGYEYNDAVKEQVRAAEPEELMTLCSESSTPFFHDQARNWKMQLDKLTQGVLTVDLTREHYLPEELRRADDVSTPEGRVAVIRQVLMMEARNAFDSDDNEALAALGQAIATGESMPALEPRTIPSPTVDRILPELAQRFAQRYTTSAEGRALLSAEHAATLGQLVAELAMKLSARGYQPAELEGFVATLSQQECEQWLRHFPQPAIEARPSANELFLEETGFDAPLRGADAIYVLWEHVVTRAIQARAEREGFQTLTPQERLEQMHSILQVSHAEVASLHQAELVGLLHEVGIASYDDLVERAAPILHLYPAVTYESKRARQEFLDAIISSCSDSVPPAEMLRFLEGEDPSVIWTHIRGAWNDAERRARMSEQEQLDFLEAALDVVPKWDSDCIDRREVEDYTERDKAAAIYSISLSIEYVRLYMVLNPGDSIVAPLKRVLRDGAINFDTSVSPHAADLQAAFDALTQPELEELARYCVEIEGKCKQAEDRSGEWGVDRIDRGVTYSIMQRALEAHGIIWQWGRWHVEPDERSEDESVAAITQFVPVSTRDTQLRDIFRVYHPGALPDEVVESGFVQRYHPIDRESHYSKSTSELIPRNIESDAAAYDPSAPSFTTIFRGDRKYSERYNALEFYIDYTQLPADPSIPAVGRVDRVQELIPEVTNYRDELLGAIETALLQERGLTTNGHEVVAPEGNEIQPDVAHELYTFYQRTIPLFADQAHQQLWSRRANSLFREHLATGEETFASELDRISELYPHASHVRGEALLQLGDTGVVRTPPQAREITRRLFDVQRRTTEDAELSQQSTVEKINSVLAYLNREDRKEFVLWTIGETDQPPRILRAFGGHNECSVEDMPDLLFAATPQEREETYIRLLFGENGVMDPREEEDEAIFQEFIDRSFERVFPPEAAEALGERGREAVRVIFTTALQEYGPFRRAKVYIEMMEVLRGQGDSTIGERLRGLLEAVGPVGIKAGQVLAEEKNADGTPLLPDDIAEELRKLQQNAKTFHRTASMHMMGAVGQFEEGHPHRLVSMDRRISAASIKQVYRATREDGQRVIAKVRRPSIAKHLGEDLRVLNRIMGNLREADFTVPDGLEDRIGRWLRDEANFQEEVRNHEAVAAAMEDYPQAAMARLFPVRIAEILDHSEEHILEEEIRGLSLRELTDVAMGRRTLADFQAKYDLQPDEMTAYEGLVGRLEDIHVQAFDALMYQIFVKGRFQADPHPGNWVVTPDGELGELDLGSAGEIAQTEIDSIKKIFLGMLAQFQNPALVQEGIRTFVPDVEAEQLERVAAVVSGTLETGEKYKEVLMIISEGGRAIHEGFEKFMKSLATGAYLARMEEPTGEPGKTRYRDISPMRLLPTVMGYGRITT